MLTEERRRFTTVLGGLLQNLQVHLAAATDTCGLAQATIAQNKGLVANPNQLPANYNPAVPRGRNGASRQASNGNGARLQSRPMSPSGPNGLPANQLRAKYAFKPTESGQVAFIVGDVIEVEGVPEDNWQYGKNLRTNITGWFPANYLDRSAPDSISAFTLTPPPVDYTSAPTVC